MLKLNFKIKTLNRIMFCTVIFLFFILIKQVSANSIKSIDMDVYIDGNGNAIVTEVWNANLTQGTEGYRPYSNLGNSEILNFSVIDESGKEYETLSSWNTSASFSSKAYKSGLHYITNGVELCWGISSYGNKTYTLKYNISNFITQYTDKQGIYFNFLNLDQYVSNAKITIHSEYPFSLDNARIWAFGNNGTINFVDGNIVLDSGGSLSSSQYMVALVRFEENLFNTSNTSTQSFDDIYDSAMSTVTDNGHDSILQDTVPRFTKMTTLYLVFMFFIVITLFLPLKKRKYKSSNKSDNIEYKPLDLGKKIKKNEVSYFREIPCSGDLFYAYWIMMKYHILKEDECKNGLIGAILLKWIKEGYIEISKTRSGLFDLKDNNYAINFKELNITNFLKTQNNIDKELMRMLMQASGDNRILEAKELENWCKKNYISMNSWFKMIITSQTTKLQQKRLIFENIETFHKLGESKTIISKHVDKSVRDEALHLMGLKRFLLDYSLIAERQNVEVHLLEDYLIFAQLLGIADKVEEQFSKIYPNFEKISNINSRNTSLYTKTLSVSIIDALAKETLRQERIIEKEAKRRERQMTRERTRTREYSHSYSGNDCDRGGGGSSYSSGGSSSGGSSGGGFR